MAASPTAGLVDLGEGTFSSLYEAHPAVTLLVDSETLQILRANRAACDFYGLSEEELGERELPSLREGPHADLEPIRVHSTERHRLPQGDVRDVEVYTGEVRYEGRPALLMVLQDVSSRRAAEEAQAAEKERLAITLGSIADGVLTADSRGRVLLMNPAAETLTGLCLREAKGKPLQEVLQLSPHDAEQLERVTAEMSTSGSFREVVSMRLEGGEERLLEVNAAPLRDPASSGGFVMAFRDVTERRRLEEERARAQKLEALGVLAGGIAHDFNNLLTVVLGNLAMIDRQQPSDLDEPLNHAEAAVLKARGLTQQLLTFSRGGAPVREAASISELISDSVAFALRGTKVRSTIEMDDDLSVVEIDADQIHQVLNNLLINAVQSMPHGGTVKVEACNATSVPAPLPFGRYVVVTIADSGGGIPAAHLPRIFDPYFSTKPRGTGLGLATAFSIVRRHEGVITVESKAGEGSTFRVYLPSSRMSAVEQREVSETEEAVVGGSILFMDDDPGVRRVGALMLQQLGYEVTTAGDGAEAIDLYCEARRRDRPYDLVIMDLTVAGGLGGKETLSRLLELHPDVVAVVASGYSNDPVMADHRRYGFKAALSKPFRTRDLARVVNRLISEHRHPEREKVLGRGR